jgi:hypothetical protein
LLQICCTSQIFYVELTELNNEFLWVRLKRWPAQARSILGAAAGSIRALQGVFLSGLVLSINVFLALWPVIQNSFAFYSGSLVIVSFGWRVCGEIFFTSRNHVDGFDHLLIGTCLLGLHRQTRTYKCNVMWWPHGHRMWELRALSLLHRPHQLSLTTFEDLD